MHDDQHGTAVVTCAALENALELKNKKAENIRVLVLGAGSAAIAIVRLMMSMFGLKKRQIMVFDSKGVIGTHRASTLESYKMSLARDTRIRTLETAIKVADVIIGVSRGSMIKPHMLKNMRQNPIIFAMANPVPEIMPAAAKEVRDDIIIATGRSDFPNQVNNSICFPYLFRAALDTRTSRFTTAMFSTAAHAIAKLAREPVPKEVLAASGRKRLEFGPDYILPMQFDPRLLDTVVPAISEVVRNPPSEPLLSFEVSI